MKKLSVNLSVLLFFLVAVCLQFSVSSCEKETIRVDTLVLKDTVTIEKDPPIFPADTAAFLTGHPWKIKEIRILQQDKFLYYLRGGVGNTADFDNENIKFDADGNGSYSADGLDYTLTWDFKGPDKTKIEYIIAYPTPLTVNWESITYRKDSLAYSEYYIRAGIKSLCYVLRQKL